MCGERFRIQSMENTGHQAPRKAVNLEISRLFDDAFQERLFSVRRESRTPLRPIHSRILLDVLDQCFFLCLEQSRRAT